MELARKAPLTVLLLAAWLISGCGGNADYTPKPRGYFRIVMPKKQYRLYDAGYPFTFLYPAYAKMEVDTTPSRNNLKKVEYKLNMQFPQFNGTLHLTYQPVADKKEFNMLIEDAYRLAFKHTVKATGIDETRISSPDRKVYGLYYNIDGNTASSVQFYLTDSTRHYLRGALYFNEAPRLDSIQPVLTFVKKDVDVMIRTLKWK
ncbi:MAG: gliding motility lipoprotein GldD [Mucilaginibacter sp.]